MAARVQRPGTRRKQRADFAPEAAPLFELDAEGDQALGEALQEGAKVKGHRAYITVHSQDCPWVKRKCTCRPLKLLCGAKA